MIHLITFMKIIDIFLEFLPFQNSQTQVSGEQEERLMGDVLLWG